MISLNLGKSRQFPLGGILLALCIAGVAPVRAQVQITLALNGYFGSNVSSSGQTLADGTVVKLGFFHSGTAFISSANVLSTWETLTGNLSSKTTSLGANFYTLASTTIHSGEFQILYTPDPEAQPDPSYQTLFTINPAVSTPSLSGIGLVNYKPFVWVETTDRSQFGLYESRTAFPTGPFFG